MSVGKRIREIRKKINLSQKDFSGTLETTQVVLSRYENESRKPTTSVLNKLNEIYHIDINWLLTGKGEMFITSPDQVTFSGSSCNNVEIEKLETELSEARTNVSILEKENKELNTQLISRLNELLSLKNEL